MIDLPEKNRINMLKINSNFVRFVGTDNKPAKVFAEVMNRGVATQSAFSDDMGLYKYDGVGVLRVYEGDDLIDFGVVVELPPPPKPVVAKTEEYIPR